MNIITNFKNMAPFVALALFAYPLQGAAEEQVQKVVPTPASTMAQAKIKTQAQKPKLPPVPSNFTYGPKMFKFATMTYKMCYMGCHSVAKKNLPKVMLPRIEGQTAEYFLNQWNAYDGDRKGSIAAEMKLLMYSYTPDQMRAVAQIAESFKMPYQPNEEVVASERFKKGKKTYVANCQVCHGEEGTSAERKYPVLRGQTSTYIFEQMINFRDQKRTNHDSAQMTPFARLLSEDDYKNVATYLSGMPFYERMKNPKFITGIGMPPVKGFKLPDTGHIYDTTEVFGEDSDYTRNDLSYSFSDSGQVTIDNNTKLMWERYMPEEWHGAFEAVEHCENLALDGYTDWRLPLMKELISIADYGNSRPAIDMQAFGNMPRGASGVWAMPVMGDHDEHAWHVGFPDAHIMGQHIYAEKLVRCVRADNNAAYNANEFVDNKDGTVSDKVTDLMWQQKMNFNLFKWEEAIAHCENMELTGYNDWHLPNVKEGVSIVDYNRHDPAIDTKYFPNTPSERFFWLSTSDAIENAQSQPDIFFKPPFPANPLRKKERIEMKHGPDHGHNVGWAVEFIVGSAFRYTKDQEFYARCVRYDD